ncbi:MAG: hypothetical protein ASARMPREDX12_003953 [Alectoria sarmentosa]|nr:MAG: hypothetical protein ASARMPREDX12_003953 [Alectoria sarmentosa]
MTTPSIACIGIIGKHDNPLHITLFSPHTSTPSAHLEFSFLLNASLDIFDARARDRNRVDQDLGMLQAVDERLSIWGWETGTGTRFAIVVDAWGKGGNRGAKGMGDGDLRGAFKALQTAYIRLLQNPFYVPDEHTPMTVASKRGNGGQITIQMLDGSIAPFKVRSSITIASLKAKFEPWQPMKGRALLHHSVELDDRATLGSVPGVKDGTILRVDKQVLEAKKKNLGRKKTMSGPANLAVDEDVLESIEMSGENEETSSENEKRLSNSKKNRGSKTSAAMVENFIDDDNIEYAPRVKTQVSGGMNVGFLSLADPKPSNRGMALHIAEWETEHNTAREQDDNSASEAQNSSDRLDSFKNIFAWPPKNPATASAHMPVINEALSSHRDLTEDNEARFLVGVISAAAEMEELPLQSESAPGNAISSGRCDACGRACRCGGGPLAKSSSLAPMEDMVGREQVASANGGWNGPPIVKRNSTSQCVESSWTGM